MAKSIILVPEKWIFTTSLLLSTRDPSKALWAQSLCMPATRRSPGKHRGWHEQTLPHTRVEINWSNFVLWAESWQLYKFLFVQQDVKGFSILALDAAIPCQIPSRLNCVVNSGEKSQMVSCNSSRVSDQSKSSGPTPAWAFNGNSHTAIDLISDSGWGMLCSSSQRLGNFHLFILFHQPLLPPFTKSPKSLSWLTALKTTRKQVVHTH